MRRAANRRLSFESLERRQLLAAEIEPNDSLTAATAIETVNTRLNGELSSSHDVDIFSIQLSRGQSIGIEPYNENAPALSPTLPPGIEILDVAGEVIASTWDGRFVSAIAPSTDVFYVRISSKSVLGSVVTNYAMDMVIRNEATVAETEPNDTAAMAQPLGQNQNVSGTFSAATDKDVFSIAIADRTAVLIDFAGLPENNPAVTITDSAGVVLGQNNGGDGLLVYVDAATSINIELVANNASGRIVKEYVATIATRTNATVESESNDRFEDATTIVSGMAAATLVGTLDDVSDRDFYRFEVQAIDNVRFELTALNQIVMAGKEIRLYNSFGQIVDYSANLEFGRGFHAPYNGRIDTARTDAFLPGVYFLEIVALDPTGVGPYALDRTNIGYSLQQDETVAYFDFESGDSYLTYDRIADYADPDEQAYLEAIFSSRLSGFDVITTTQRPDDGTEYVANGIGLFEDFGGGEAGGRPSYRAPAGYTANTATTHDLVELRRQLPTRLIHEFSHVVGTYHARDVQAYMGYLNTTEYLPFGDAFEFYGRDSRRPQETRYDARNYFDWKLQPGSQYLHNETLESNASVSIDKLVEEMSWEFFVTEVVSTLSRPFYAKVGDFNGDGRPDVAVACDVGTTDSVEIFLSNPDGTFADPVIVSVPNLISTQEPLAVGDFDGDGNDDFAIIDSDTRQVKIYASFGNGSFAAPIAFVTTQRPVGIAAGDVDDDGSVDLVVLGFSATQSLINDGSGMFTALPTTTTPDDGRSIDLGDFNGDGNLDAVVGSRNSSSVAVLLGTGLGTFNSTTVLPTNKIGGIAVGDFNHDGFDDFAAVSESETGVSVFLSDNGIGFESPELYTTQSVGFTLKATDANGDGVMDLIASGFGRSVQVLAGVGDGTFTRAINIPGGTSVSDSVSADFDGDGTPELLFTSLFDHNFSVAKLKADDPVNDRATIIGKIDSPDDIDRFELTVAAGDRWTFDVDAAEFQYGLDSIISVFDSEGNLIIRNDNGLDRNSGVTSVDSFIDHVFEVSGKVSIEVSGAPGSMGDYRFKATPERALDKLSPRVIAVLPDNGSQVESTRQVIFFFNDQIDPSTLIAQNVTVRGATSGLRTGKLVFNVLDASLVWTADQDLPVDEYTIEISGSSDGLTDLFGNRLDGEIASDFKFPVISGDGNAGGSFQTSFSVTSPDSTPATVNSIAYRTHQYNRGEFRLDFSDRLSIPSVREATFTLRGSGSDGSFGTLDDTVVPLDATYQAMTQYTSPVLYLYTRGVPDSGHYRVEGTVRDEAGHLITLSESVFVSSTVPESALFTTSALTSPGVMGSYVNQSLQRVTSDVDWRTNQVVAGTRTDANISFHHEEFGTRASVGLTPDNDEYWDSFSVQWDGYVVIPEDGIQLVARTSDGSRLWVDIDGDGAFESSSGELFDNGWGSYHLIRAGQPTPPLSARTYKFRMQFSESSFADSEAHLEWIWPEQSLDYDGLFHGPIVTALSIAPEQLIGNHVPDSIAIDFSGHLLPSTINTNNIQLRYSPDETFFDGNDSFLIDADGIVDWDVTHFRATLKFDQPFPDGYYLLELNGGDSGIANTIGHVLDGEFLTSVIAGNSDPSIWKQTTSGDGIPGNDFRSPFHVMRVGVQSIDPEVSWPSPADISFGTLLSSAQLNASSPTPGTFSYDPVIGSTLNAGANQVLTVTFVPTDESSFNTITLTRSITVNKAEPDLTWANVDPIVFGTPLSTLQLNASSMIAGAFEYTPSLGTLLNAGDRQELLVSFTPTDQLNFNSAAATALIDVLRADPAISWPMPSAIVFGAALTSDQLNASSNTDGTFVYEPSMGAKLSAGAGQSLKVTFTPTDTANYKTITKNTTIDVEKAVPELNWPTPDDIPFGIELSQSQLNATSDVAGKFAYTPAIGTQLDVGVGQSLQATFTPDDGVNYQSVTLTRPINVSRATPQVTWMPPDDLTFGIPLSHLHLNATSDVSGEFVYHPAIGEILEVGADQELTATFTPSDLSHFSVVHLSRLIDVLEPVLDFGDAPAKYPVTLDRNGARHRVGDLKLGTSIDVEANGRPSANAAGDGSDEDGIIPIASIISSDVETISSLRIQSSGIAKLDGWIDFNQDGDWDDLGEQVFVSEDVVAGENQLSFIVPKNLVAGDTAARFRISVNGGLSPTGLAESGEVEDYLVPILAADPTAHLSLAGAGSEMFLGIEDGFLVFRNQSRLLARVPVLSVGGIDFKGSSSDEVLQIALSGFPGEVLLSFDGGAGNDSLVLVDSGTNLDLTSNIVAGDARFQLAKFEVIDISGSGDNRLKLDTTLVKSIASDGVLRLRANQGDQIDFGSNWKLDSPQIIDSETTHVLLEDSADGTARIELVNDRYAHNPLNRFDTNRDKRISALDALRVINEMGRRGGDQTIPSTAGVVPSFYYDVNGDDRISAIDALQIINQLARLSLSEGGELVPANAFQSKEMQSQTRMFYAEDIASVDSLETTKVRFFADAEDGYKTTTSPCLHEIDQLMSHLGEQDQPSQDVLTLLTTEFL